MPRKLGEVRTRDLIVLWARAAGRCSHPGCKTELVADGAAIGEAAHIIARATGGPRGMEVGPEKIHSYDNLILLCGHHHSLVDKAARKFPVEELRAWKAEHEAWVAAVTAPVAEAVPWVALVQDPDSVVDVEEAAGALGGGNRVAERLVLRGEDAAREWRAVELTVKRTPVERRRFAVFSLGRIPLAVQLGYVLTDRTRAEVFQYDRDRGTWAWPDGAAGDAATWTASGSKGGEANIRVSLSARVERRMVPEAAVDIEIAVAEPSVRWLRTRDQLDGLRRVYGEVLAEVRRSRCRRVHLYYAGPTPGAVEFGRAYNRRMNPELVVWEWNGTGYERGVELNKGR